MSNPVIEFTLLEPAAEAPSSGPLTATVWTRVLKALLPPGRLWNLDPDSELSRTLAAAADELARIDARARTLLDEANPLTTTELLPDFERALGLASEGSLAERRGRVVALLVRRQRFRPVDFKVALAPILGLAAEDVEVIERTRAQAVAMDDDSAIFRFYIYRDPGAPGSYSVADAQALVDRIKPSHTRGRVFESKRFKCGDPHSICGRDLLAPDPVV